MRVELDSSMRIVVDDDGQKLFHCNCYYQYNGLMKELLTPSQLDIHLGDGKDGVYHISKKRLELGKQYMANNPFNEKKPTN